LVGEQLEMPNSGGQIVGIPFAEPGSRSEQAIAMLAATLDPADPARAPA
jgi:hypothetical protein